MDYIPDQGDIIWLNFDPSGGREIIKRRPAFVISRKAFNAHTELAIVAPITSTVRGIKLEVVLPDKMATQGSVLVHQLKSLDFQYRQAEWVERAPKKIIEQVCAIAKVILS
ncbi:MAG TPA: type II toxin-antitoxin system PemK/MazF family toxin [Gammaproteobacteria bacterium]|nr:type II toxin-antitoxin system PemK/MazF family toxin [Gammaproteobacteria bacterium]